MIRSRPTMQRDFATQVTGGLFVLAAVLLWGGWMLMPWHIGTFFAPPDFAGVQAHLYVWIWLYRVHIFGLVIAVMALVALAALVSAHPARILVWPGVAVSTAGLIVGGLAAAFYYHFGAWGAVTMQGQPAEALQAFTDGLRIDTEYVTCLVRFSRVFTGLGLLVLAGGVLKWRLLPRWSGMAAAVLGIAAMALTMGLPDHLDLFLPIFHLQALWFAATGGAILRAGLGGAV